MSGSAEFDVKVISGHPMLNGDTCVAKKGSPVWAALVNEPVGTRVETWGITYEKATP